MRLFWKPTKQLCQLTSAKLRHLHQVYNVTPYLRAQEQLTQAAFLTKTVLRSGLPQVYTSSPSSHQILIDDRERLVEEIEQSIISTSVFHRDEPLTFKRRTRDRSKLFQQARFHYQLAAPLIENMLKITWTSGSEGDFLSKNISYRPDICAPWSRGEEKIQVTGKLGRLVCGTSLLPLFMDDVTATAEEVVQWDDIISPYFDIGVSSSRFEAKSGFHDGAPYPCPQTLFIINNHMWYPRFTEGQALFYTFSHALNHALASGEKMGAKQLDRPVPVQAVCFDGRTFTFVCYQLNTLDFADDTGVKNLAWVAGEQRLFDGVREKMFRRDDLESEDFIRESVAKRFTEFHGQRVSLTEFDRTKLTKTFKDEQILEVAVDGFNADAANLFLDFVYNCSKLKQ